MTITHEINKDATRLPLSVMVTNNKVPEDLTGKTVKFYMVDDESTEAIAEATTGISIQPTFVVEFDTDANRIIAEAHRLKEGDEVIFETDGTLPAVLKIGRAHV